MAEVFAYIDGACSGNPGPGGWGALLILKESGTVVNSQELKGGEANTTNNRMELTAAIQAIESTDTGAKLTVVTDSQYVKNGITTWIHSWKRKNWVGSAGPVKNVDLWKKLDTLNSSRSVSWEWVKGHAGHAENEKADKLANEGLALFKIR